MSGASKWKVEFYEDARGRRPVTDFLDDLDAKDRARIARTVMLLETYGVQLGMPYARHVRGKIFELRAAAGRRDYRIFYAPARGLRFVLLHAFAKTTNKTPERELEIAERRWADHNVRMEEKRK